MKLIKSNVEIWEQEPGISGVYKQIERVGRVCYRSESHIKEGSAEKFVNKLSTAEHFKALEQGTVYLEVDKDNDKYGLIDFYTKSCYSVVNIVSDKYYITTNYRVLYENSRLSDLEYWVEPGENHERRVTAHFICDRGVSAEANRHTTSSAMEMSTRYCNFSKDKFDNSVGIILPSDIDESKLPTSDVYGMAQSLSRGDSNSWGVVDWWWFANSVCELSYMKLLELGWKPQQARRILPLDLRTELCHTTFVHGSKGWEHFFRLRCDKAHAHPDIYELAYSLQQQMTKLL